MRVAILGCGSMGTILGAFLNKNGCPAVMIDSYEAHVKALNEKGAQVVGTQEFNVPVKAITPEQMEGIYDLVFLFTKQTANEEVLPKLLPHLSESSTVCTLQNGVPEPFVAKYVGQSRTVGGTVLWSATFQEPGISRLTQDVSNLACFFDIGEMDGSDTPRIHQVAEVLSKMGPAVVMPDLMAARWGKLINNACVSGMSAVCGATFGAVVDDRKSRACLSFLGNEVKVCCEAEGYKLPTLVGGYSPDSLDIKTKEQYDENQRMWPEMYSVARPAKASMLQDLEKGKITEVTMINGYVSEVGRKHGIPTPFNDTVVKVVQGIERGELPLSFDNLKFFDNSWFTYGL